MTIDLADPPELYWHCAVKTPDAKSHSVANDLTFEKLNATIVRPWRDGRPFTVAGAVINPSPAPIAEIRITHTDRPLQHFIDEHDARNRASGVVHFGTQRAMLPLWRGTDLTNELLFTGIGEKPAAAEVSTVLEVCRRIHRTASVLAQRSRSGKESLLIVDEYDVQDLLHATLRAYVRHSVQEEPLPRVGGVRSSRADISIEDLGVLIELKYAREHSDQKRLVEELSQDLTFYAAWPHLKVLIFVIYGSSKLRDPEQLEKLGGTKEISGRRFEVHVVLV